MFDPNDRNTLQALHDPASHSHANPQLDTSRPGRRLRSRILWGGLALLALVILLVVGVKTLGNNPNYFPAPLAQQIPVPVLFLIDIGIILVLALVLRIFWRVPRRKFFASIIGIALLTVVIVAVIWGTLINPYVGMTRTSFLRNSVSIDNGDTLHLQNPANGVTQLLCIGVDQKCQEETGAPGTLNHGIRVKPGQSITITFATDGDYQITSATTPGMNLSIDVSTPTDTDSGGE